jgi:hypothetical protein
MISSHIKYVCIGPASVHAFHVASPVTTAVYYNCHGRLGCWSIRSKRLDHSCLSRFSGCPSKQLLYISNANSLL